MALEGKHGIVAHHADAVVGDLDQLFAAGFDLYVDAARARVQRVLEQLLHHRRRTLHHLARGDLVGYVLGKYVDAAHGLTAVASCWLLVAGLSSLSAPEKRFLHVVKRIIW